MPKPPSLQAWARAQRPPPKSCDFMEGRGKVSSQAKVTWHLPSHTGLLLLFLGPPCSVVPPPEERAHTKAWGQK